MTLIVTQFSHHGIVLAADSNISSGRDLLGVRRKLFRVPAIGAGIAYAGGFGIAGRALDEWMDEFIASEQNQFGDLRAFCDGLAERLNSERSTADKAGPLVAHVAAWVDGVPTMWHISNVNLELDNGGRYSAPVESITVRGPDFALSDWRALVAAPIGQMPVAHFVNGAVQGRIAYNTHEHLVGNWLRSLWQADDLPFHAPSSIWEQEASVRTSMEVMRLLFRLSPMAAAIGGTIQSLAISADTLGEVCFVTEAVPDTLVEGAGGASLDDDWDSL
jgi:hypothetical protein